MAFVSHAANLVPGDGNGMADIFVHNRLLNRASPANVGVSLAQRPEQLARLGIGQFEYTLNNHGPNPAKAVRILHSVSNGQVARFIPSQGSCRRHATISLRTLGALPPNASLTLGLEVSTLRAVPLSQHLSVSSPEKDSAPGNNSVSVETPVTP